MGRTRSRDAEHPQNDSNRELTNRLSRQSYPLGILANARGVLFSQESQKATQFIQLANQIARSEAPVLVTSAAIRPFVRSLVERFRSQTTVLSQAEIHPRARLKTVGSV